MSDKAIESKGPKQDDMRHFGNFLKEVFSLIFCPIKLPCPTGTWLHNGAFLNY